MLLAFLNEIITIERHVFVPYVRRGKTYEKLLYDFSVEVEL
jgi:hypothetical protein